MQLPTVNYSIAAMLTVNQYNTTLFTVYYFRVALSTVDQYQYSSAHRKSIPM
jgi:hypothetical protein